MGRFDFGQRGIPPGAKTERAMQSGTQIPPDFSVGYGTPVEERGVIRVRKRARQREGEETECREETLDGPSFHRPSDSPEPEHR